MTAQEQLRADLRSALDAALADVELNPDEDLTELAQRMASVARGISCGLDEALGPFYDAATVASFSDIPYEKVAEEVHSGAMFGMLTPSGVLVLPTFGFDGNAVADWVPPVIGAMGESGVDGWTMGLWLKEPNMDLEDKTPLEWLQGGRDCSAVLALARGRSEHWSA